LIFTLLVAAAGVAALVLVLRSEQARGCRHIRRAQYLRDSCRPAEAAIVLQEPISWDQISPGLLNLAVEIWISAGDYLQALTVQCSFNPVTADDAKNLLLVQINRAEAEYNLGRWKAAWSRLCSLDARVAPYPITRAGLALQRAWILSHTNRAEEALWTWERADMDGLPYQYRAEHYFTHVAVLLALGRIEQAADAAAAGADAAVRPSSERNALFMLARVDAAKGEWERAEVLCRTAANHPFRGQGGDGLLLWGDVLTRLGRLDEARQAYELCIARDGQSESALVAGARQATLHSLPGTEGELRPERGPRILPLKGLNRKS